MQACYTGPAGTADVGICTAGVETCEADGSGFGPCVGELTPQTDVCLNGVDEDCDGSADDEINDPDGDGYSVCAGFGDCCELGESCGADPALVNPGAYEVLGNGVDDDCDASTDDLIAPSCSMAADFNATGLAMANAMELCETASDLDPPGSQTWGVLQADIVRVDLSDVDNRQKAVLTAFGPVVALNGATFAGISSGRMRALGQPDAGGFNTDFGHDSVPPTSYTDANGGGIPGEAGCVAATTANDSAMLRLRIRVPANARSFSYDFRYASGEPPVTCPTNFQDPYLALLASGAAGLPADGNVSAQDGGIPFNPVSPLLVTCGAAGCLGTGLATSDKIGPWMTTTAPVVPGEEIVLELMVFDTSDNLVDSLTLFDHFRWSTDAVPSATTVPTP
jgi:hypothetical protein